MTSFRILSILFAVGVTTIVAAAQAQRSPWQRDPAEIRRTLDSLAAASSGPYIHFVVGSCLGSRCEERVSLYRVDPETPYVYRAAAWVGMPAKPQFYGVNRELPEGEAGSILADARLAGIMSLVADSAERDRRQPRFWLRARFGGQTLSIDGASLSSLTYDRAAVQGPGATYAHVEEALFALLRDAYGKRGE
jgi:hypothetical protein